MARCYIIEGPAVVGNEFAIYGVKVPADRFVIVEDGEYADGGSGPSLVSCLAYLDRATAERAVAQENGDPVPCVEDGELCHHPKGPRLCQGFHPGSSGCRWTEG